MLGEVEPVGGTGSTHLHGSPAFFPSSAEESGTDRPAERRPMGSSKDGRVERKQEGPGRQQGHAWLRPLQDVASSHGEPAPVSFRPWGVIGLPVGSLLAPWAVSSGRYKMGGRSGEKKRSGR